MFWIVRTGLAAGLAFAVPLTSFASIDPQESRSETRIGPSVSDAGRSAGESEFVFDTALNKTRARFRTSLAHGKGFFRALAGSPPVHTLIADYEVPGRTAFQLPEAVRVTLKSSEFALSASGYRPSDEPRPVLEIAIGDRIARYRVGIAQTVEELSAPNAISQVSQPVRGNDPGVNSPQAPTQLDIERTATAWIPVCDFLTLVQGKSARGTVAGLEFELNDDVVAGLRQFAGRMAATASARADCNH